LFLTATGCALAGAAVGNVLMPGLVKRYFAERTGSATAWYTTALAVGMTGGAALTGPAEQVPSGDWRIGLGVWAALALAAVPPWWVVARLPALAPGRPADGPRRPDHATPVVKDRAAVAMTDPGRRVAALARAGQTSATLGIARRRPAVEDSRVPLHRVGLARALTLFFGCQSLNAYVVLGWLPSILTDAGWDARSASLPLALFSAMAVPMSLALPALAGRRRDQRGLVALTTACYAGGYLGLLAAPLVPGGLGVLGWLSAGLLGAGNGAFPLAVTLIGLRSRRTEVTTALSALVQGGGYLLAVVGPLLVGWLHQTSGGWRLPLMLALGTLVPQLLGGWRSARPGTVEGGPDPDPGPSGRPGPARHRRSRAAQPWRPAAAGRRSSGPMR
jgi:CP family cyanate transporter-like MFS transporter